MSADGGSAVSGDPTRYRKLADEVRALINSGTLHAHDTLEDLLQLAAWYAAVAELAEHMCKADGPTGPLPSEDGLRDKTQGRVISRESDN